MADVFRLLVAVVPPLLLLLVRVGGAPNAEASSESPLGALGRRCPAKCECRLEETPKLVNCSGRKLREFPLDDVPPEVQFLDLSDNQIASVPINFPEWSFLEILSLAGNRIASFPPRALQNLEMLQVLDLSRNEIESLKNLKPDKFIAHNEHLQMLNLSWNRIRDLGYGGYMSLASDSLRDLDVSNCFVSSVDGNEALSSLPALRTLRLQGNLLRELPALHSQSLELLDVSYCQLQSLAVDFLSSSPNLSHLLINGNPDFTRIDLPEGPVAWSKSLRFLNVSECSIRDMSFLGAMPNLTHALLRGNRIPALNPYILQDNTPLLELDLADNHLEELPANSLDGPTALQTLDLSGNKITSIHWQTFSKHNSLTKLNVSRNPLASLNLTSPALRVLDASHGNIKVLANQFLDQLPRLRHLNLSNNPLDTLPPRLVSPNASDADVGASLHTLDISLCRLTSLPSQILEGLTLLTSLNLRGNRLTEALKVEMFHDNDLLESLRVEDNPWRCQCGDNDFRAFMNYLMKHPMKIEDIANLKCQSPDSVTGMDWFTACQTLGSTSRAGQNAWIFVGILVACVVGVGGVFLAVRWFSGGKIGTRRRQEERDAENGEAEHRRRLRQQQENDEGRRTGTNQTPNSDDAVDGQDVPGAHVYDPPSYEEAMLMDRMTQEDPEDVDQEDSEDEEEPQVNTRDKVPRIPAGLSGRHPMVLEEVEEEDEETEDLQIRPVEVNLRESSSNQTSTHPTTNGTNGDVRGVIHTKL